MRRVALLLAATAVWLFAGAVAGIKWSPPAGWKDQGARPMRAATYAVPDDGECAVFFFGSGQGGAIDANIERWRGQLGGARGVTGNKTVRGLKVTTVDISGSYGGMGGAPAKPGYRLLGAIVEAPEGNVFFKFTGPAKTVKANEAAFNAMIAAVTR